MAWFLCDIVTTSGPDGVEHRPAIVDHTLDWSAAVTLEAWGKILVRCQHVPSMDGDSRIERMRRGMLNGGGTPDRPDDWENPAIALALVQRGLALQQNPNLQGLALTRAAEKIKARVLPSAGPGKRGTFTDTFDTPGSNTNLEDWTPTGGTSWNRLNGAAGHAVVNTAGSVQTTNNAVFSITPDQGSADQYVEWVETGTGGSSAFFICRLIDTNNFIGARAYQSGSREVWRKTSGGFTQLGSSSFSFSEDDVFRFEVNGNDYELFVNDVSIISGSESQGNTETTQGFGGSSAATGLAAKSYEAGSLSGGTPTATGALEVQPAVVVGAATRTVKATGGLKAGASTMVGVASSNGATDTGWVIAGAGANRNDAGAPWINPGNITADDGTNASTANDASGTDALVSSSHGFSIPANATILGVEVRIQARRGSGTANFDRVRIVKGGSIGATDRAAGALTATDADYDFGGSEDLWDETLTPADVNAAGFGAAFAFRGSAVVVADAVWVKVHYIVAWVATGALKAQQAIMAGAAQRNAKVIAAMQAQLAAIAGAASREAKAEGALQAQAAEVVGSGTAGGGAIAEGELKAQDAVVDGVATSPYLAEGVLKAGDSVIAGSTTRGVKATGALQSGLSRIVGVASRGPLLAVGVLKAGAVKIAGVAKVFTFFWRTADDTVNGGWSEESAKSGDWTEESPASTTWTEEDAP